MNTKPPKRIGNANTRYNTPLSATEEAQYQKWVKTLPVNLRDDYDYDLRGAWLAKVKPDQYGHMPDLYKKPWHPTFSVESYYSMPPNEGGSWNEDNFIPSSTNEIMDAIRQSPFYQYGDYPYGSYAKGGKIHIKKENRGKFTAAANKAGKSVQAYASQILANKENYSPTLVKRANFARNASKWHAEGGSLKQHWDPKNPHHLHTNDDKVVSFTEDAYNALPSNLKQQVDEHYNAMNTFENQYMVNPEYAEFLKKVKNTNLADNVIASTGEYWDKNWFDPNYKNGAYSFDNNGILTYKGQTYAPWGNRSSDGITVPMRTPNGVSYGSNYVYYPITIPEQYIEKPIEKLETRTYNTDILKQIENKKRSDYIKNNSKVLYKSPNWQFAPFDNYWSYSPHDVKINDDYEKYYYGNFSDWTGQATEPEHAPVVSKFLFGKDYGQTDGRYLNSDGYYSNNYHNPVNLPKEALDYFYNKLRIPVHDRDYIVGYRQKPTEEEIRNNSQVTLDDIINTNIK